MLDLTNGDILDNTPLTSGFIREAAAAPKIVFGAKPVSIINKRTEVVTTPVGSIPRPIAPSITPKAISSVTPVLSAPKATTPKATETPKSATPTAPKAVGGGGGGVGGGAGGGGGASSKEEAKKEGETAPNNEIEQAEQKKSYLPIIAALFVAVGGYLYAKNKSKNVLAFTLIGAGIGAGLGLFAKKFMNKSESATPTPSATATPTPSATPSTTPSGNKIVPTA